ncbi:hypothetical protein [uncultured Psychroserpens sp.]|uniref:hypothetical protein n=1 Tax=uncultured Psychroserpens sp. TaxID=255436 RepID=UPI002611F8CB|nr:hypothetical protein [uncultured Psychroserpens sp.]
MKYSIVVLAITLSFFLGRESKNVAPKQYIPSSHIPNSFNNSQVGTESLFYTPNNIQVRLEPKDTVFRCGQSKIYHPTLSHGSFKNCKSKVYKLTVERAKELGMRHCRCSS